MVDICHVKLPEVNHPLIMVNYCIFINFINLFSLRSPTYFHELISLLWLFSLPMLRSVMGKCLSGSSRHGGSSRDSQSQPRSFGKPKGLFHEAMIVCSCAGRLLHVSSSPRWSGSKGPPQWCSTGRSRSPSICRWFCELGCARFRLLSEISQGCSEFRQDR